ncbi:MAG: HAD family phosphatase [Bifidobacteriaceae bacterium]|nr:HAD family phosphatase [Bifidobacteriaceae bacterium]
MKGWPGEPQMQYDVVIAQDAAAKNVNAPVKHVMFDFGNVLVYWNPEDALLSRYDMGLIDQFLDNDISGFYDANDLMDSGESISDAVAYVRNNYGEFWASMFQYYLDNFIDSIPGVVPGARKLIEDLKNAGVGVYGLSNWHQDTFAQAQQYFHILQSLDDSVISGQVHMRKPHEEIYEFALQKFNILPEHTLFVDDKAMNIVGANKVGVRGIRFLNPRVLRSNLIELGVDIPPLIA